MKKISKFLTSILALAMLASCAKSEPPAPPQDDEGVDEVVETLVKPTEVTAFEYDDTDYSSMADVPTNMIRIHYRRKDNNNSFSNYIGWRVWGWDAQGGNGWWYEFTKYDAYGVICDIPVSAVAANGQTINQLGTVFTDCESQTATWSGVYSKEPNNDIMCTIAPNNKGGVQHLYVLSTTPAVYYSQDAVFMSVIDYARVNNSREIRLVINTPHEDFKLYKNRLTVYFRGQLATGYTIEDFQVTFKGGSYQAAATLKFTEDFNMNDDILVKYRVAQNNISEAKAIITSYYDSEEFEAKYNYTGNDLGATFDNEENPTKTIFKVWSPVATAMKLKIYNSGDYRISETPRVFDMTLGVKGVWSIELEEDLDGKYYTYEVTNSLGTNEVVDPYAKSAGLNGRRGMIVNFTKLNKELQGWSADERPDFGTITNASIYELHIRDMTINPNSGVRIENRGKYLGLTETGTKHVGENNVEVTTGLDHLEELGITHVQIQPTYDYSSVDESEPTNVMSKVNYNWGYDPQNYNALEGSYSSDPSDGYARIREFKQMIMALHSKGINAIMDVVYNHTSSFAQSNFELLVPNYYHRTKGSGVPYNGSGCGNEMASERFMVNKFVRESCIFWTNEYHLGGFRFDLMGLMDNQVMIDIYNDCHALYNKILIFGEPWTGGSSKLTGGVNPDALKSQQTVQASLNQSFFAGAGVYVGAFSDGFRNSARGDNSPGVGFVTGNTASADGLTPGMQGLFSKGNDNVEPQQVINYVSCHDNYTLNDQLIDNLGGRSMKKAYSQAETLVFSAQGIPFMQEGEDFFRTKYDEESETYIHNSYNTGDFINNMDYELKAKNVEMFEFFKRLIQFRKDNEFLRLDSRAKINAAITKCSADSAKGIVEVEISFGGENYLIVHVVNSTNYSFAQGASYELMFSNIDSYQIGQEFTGSVAFEANASVILRRV